MSIKEILYQKCIELVNSKISIAEQAMSAAQESANSEEKSTAGDKHDTARAMSHIERDMYAKQLNEAALLKKNVQSLNITNRSEVIESGSLVIVDDIHYFIAVGLGGLTIEEKNYFVISPVSPLGQVLIGKKENDVVLFQGKSRTIKAVQ